MNTFDAKGQKVFIEPAWITGETCLFNVRDPYTYRYAVSKLTKMRGDFVKRLQNEGFTITADKHDADVVYLIMNDEAICDQNEEINDYKKLFDKKMFEAGGDNLNYPMSVTMEEFFENPFFPAVLKNELMNAGIDKILIENETQLSKLKEFYEDYKDDPNYKDTFKSTIFQKYLKSPGKYYSYIRVLMNSGGKVMGASLKYSKTEETRRELKGTFEPALLEESSKYYIGAKRMFNYYANGDSISFTQPRYSTEKSEVLKLHSIDPSNPKIPSEVLEVASNIAIKCNDALGVMCGIDFMYNEIDGKWYYLEVQAFPSVDEWLREKGIKPINVKSIDDYIKYNAIELEARYEALIDTVNKVKEEKEKVYKI